MEALEYDKLSEAKDLRAASFSAKQAESIVGTVSRAMRINQQIARDLASLKARVDNDMATKADLERFATKSDFRDLRADTRDGLTELRSEMLQGFGRLHRMLVSGMVSMSILMAAVAAGIATVATLIIQIR